MYTIMYRNGVELKSQEGGTILETLSGKKQEGVGVFGSLSDLLPFRYWTYDKR